MWTLCGGIYISQGRLLLSCFGFVKCLQDFRSPKQALINAFYNYVRKPINRITGAKVVIFCEMSKCLRRKLKDYCIIQGFARMRFGANRQRCKGCALKNEREVLKVNSFRKRGNFFRDSVNLFRKAILRKVLFLRCGVDAEFSRSSLGCRSVK